MSSPRSLSIVLRGTPHLLVSLIAVVLWTGCGGKRPISSDAGADANGGGGGPPAGTGGAARGGNGGIGNGGVGGSATGVGGGAATGGTSMAGSGGGAGTASGGRGGGGGTSGTAGVAGTSGGARGGAAGGGRGGTGGVREADLVPCPLTPPSGACTTETLACEYSGQTCDCNDGAWRCTPCPATQPRPTDSCESLPAGALMNCTYGSVTCSCNDWIVGDSWACAVCPVAEPTTDQRCAANAPYECHYGKDDCVCDGNTWYCSAPQCDQARPGIFPVDCAWPATYTCEFPAQDQFCTCGDVFGSAQCTCPAVMPDEETLCLGPAGENSSGCRYGDRLCECADGLWRCEVCPIDVPANGSACSLAANCSYPAGLCFCDGTRWSCS